MTVKELKTVLEVLPDDMEVIIDKRSEGDNGYSPLHYADADAVYEPETEWYGEVYWTDWTAEEAGMDETKWREFLRYRPGVLVLSPVN
jgi:hypothetical protein